MLNNIVFHFIESGEFLHITPFKLATLTLDQALSLSSR